MQENISNGYIFISHSHKDIEKVRQIRNDMEDAGFDPLCFYLKCLTDKDEIEGLIKREIDSRELFVYIDSPNSRASDWVKKERDYIDSIGNKKTLTINLELYDSMQDISKILIKGLRVYISYSHSDAYIAFGIANKLKEREFQVLTDYDLMPGENWVDSLTGMIKDASKAGAFIVLLTENSIQSKNVKNEIKYAKSLNSLIIPIVVGDFELPDEFKLLLHDTKLITIKKPNIKDDYLGLKAIETTIDDEDFNNTMEHVAIEIWNATKRKFE